MKPVFLDTVGLIALWNIRDQWHIAADNAMNYLVDATQYVTTTYVLLECGNAMARSADRSRVSELWKELSRFGNLYAPTAHDIEQAWSAYDRGEAGEAGIVDHVSFVVMRRLGLTDAFTNDWHFRAAGFVTLF
jgi:predicted nucleic acid-binding protein